MVLYTGATVEEAIQKGLNDLDIPRMKAHITVVAREKKGFLGLFGKKPAQVEIEPIAETTVVKANQKAVKGVPDEINAHNEPVKTVSEATVDLVNMQIDTNEPGRVIGYHGKVLKALQLLAQNYLYNRYSKNFYITINVNDYVEHRAEVLQSYAQKLATRALEDGQAQQTDPMSNSERKIIHRIVSKMEGVTSYSEGEEPNRYVVVDIEG